MYNITAHTHHPTTISFSMGGLAVAVGFHLALARFVSPYTQSSSSTGPRPSAPPSQSSTYTVMPPVSSLSSSSSGPCVVRSNSCRLLRAEMRSSARGVALGGSSTICSQPTGGEPGGEMRKFFVVSGGQRYGPSGPSLMGSVGVGSPRKTRSTMGSLYSHEVIIWC
jgi:hypothetical protein